MNVLNKMTKMCEMELGGDGSVGKAHGTQASEPQLHISGTHIKSHDGGVCLSSQHERGSDRKMPGAHCTLRPA